jgi:glycosyltransferase involved in cell wall biosynthesis
MKVSMFTSWDTECGIADYSRQFKAALEFSGVSVEIVPVGSKKGIFDLIRLGKMMNNADIAFIQHQFPFFAHSFLMRSFVHCIFFLRQIKIPKVLNMHELVPLGDQLSRFPFLCLYQTIFASVDFITVHTGKHRKMILEMGVHNDKVILMPHPIPELSLLGNTKQHYKKLLRVEGKQVLTVFGFLNSRKGYELVLDAIQDLDDCVFLIAGGPFPGDKSGYAESLINKIREMRLEQRVKILGYLPESRIPAIMGATDIILAPFRDMPGSGSLSLGVAYCKAIIGSDIEQMKELQSRGIGAELFQIDKKGDLREKIVALTGDVRKQAELERLSTSYADTYSYSNTAVRLRKLFAALLKS